MAEAVLGGVTGLLGLNLLKPVYDAFAKQGQFDFTIDTASHPTLFQAVLAYMNTQSHLLGQGTSLSCLPAHQSRGQDLRSLPIGLTFGIGTYDITFTALDRARWRASNATAHTPSVEAFNQVRDSQGLVGQLATKVLLRSERPYAPSKVGDCFDRVKRLVTAVSEFGTNKEAADTRELVLETLEHAMGSECLRHEQMKQILQDFPNVWSEFSQNEVVFNCRFEKLLVPIKGEGNISVWIASAAHEWWKLSWTRSRVQQSGGDLEELRLSTSREHAPKLCTLLGQVAWHYHNTHCQKVSIFQPSGTAEWLQTHLLPRRSVESIFLEEKQYVLERVRNFLNPNTRTEYETLQRPYRLTVLLYGIPGSGKTSLVQMIASEVRANIYYLSLANKLLSATSLNSLIAHIPDGNFLVIEDIDAALKDNGMGNFGMGVSFDELLNVLDGLVAFTGKVAFITTNYRDKLITMHKALLRHGRVDMQVEFRRPSRTQIEHATHFFLRQLDFSKDVLELLLAKNWACTAQLQDFLWRCRSCRNMPEVVALLETEKFDSGVVVVPAVQLRVEG